MAAPVAAVVVTLFLATLPLALTVAAIAPKCQWLRRTRTHYAYILSDDYSYMTLEARSWRVRWRLIVRCAPTLKITADFLH